jgi:ABC-type branched-subunit amino acid transport system substrate-binding protein
MNVAPCNGGRPGFERSFSSGVATRRYPAFASCVGRVLAALSLTMGGCTQLEPLPAGACESNQQCIDESGGSPAICRRSDGRCVEVLSEDCVEVFNGEALARDDTLVLGLLHPFLDEFASSGGPATDGVKMAFDELEAIRQGVPLVGDNRRTRKLAVVACHERGGRNEDQVHLRAARHLVEGLEVPAIIGCGFTPITIEVATEVAVPSGVLMLSPLSAGDAITRLDDDNLVWRTVPPVIFEAPAYARLVSELETTIRTRLGSSIEEPLRLTIATKGDAFGRGFREAIRPNLRLGGGELVLNDPNIDEFEYADRPDSAEARAELEAYAEQVARHRPHMVLFVGTNEAFQIMLPHVERSWEALAGAATPRPRYVFTRGSQLQDLLDVIRDVESTVGGGASSLHQRVVGTSVSGRGAIYDAFRSRFQARFGRPAGRSAEHGYDAGFLLQYAVAHASVNQRTNSPTGKQLATAMESMSSGQQSPPTEAGIGVAIQEILAGRSIDYDGASGSLDFDPSTGEAPADIEVWCIELGGRGSLAFASPEGYYDYRTGTFTGPVICEP